MINPSLPEGLMTNTSCVCTRASEDHKLGPCLGYVVGCLKKRKGGRVEGKKERGRKGRKEEGERKGEREGWEEGRKKNFKKKAFVKTGWG